MSEAPKPAFSERVLPSAATFVLPFLLGLGLLAVFWPILGPLAFFVAVVGALIATGLLVYSAPTIQVADGWLSVGKARIEVKYVGAVIAVSKENAFGERGNRLDARAYTRFQPSVSTLIRVEIADPADPTPYWLFSTRRGDELVKTLRLTGAL